MPASTRSWCATSDAPVARKLWIFAMVFGLMTLLTFYTMGKSKGLSDFLDALSNERMGLWDKLMALGSVWRRGGEAANKEQCT